MFIVQATADFASALVTNKKFDNIDTRRGYGS
jgi:hypothetical protein